MEGRVSGMKCLRCGYCCKNLCVVIVNDPEKGLVENNFIFHEGGGVACKHLIGEGQGNYSCAIHDKPWYKDTPCFSHTQFETSDVPCRIGDELINRKHKKYRVKLEREGIET
jgi:hypothetical protein